MSDPSRASLLSPDPYAPPRSPPLLAALPAPALISVALIHGLSGGLLSLPCCLVRSTSIWGATRGIVLPGLWFWLLAILISMSLPTALFHLLRPVGPWRRLAAVLLSTSMAAGLAVAFDTVIAHPIGETAPGVLSLSGLASLGILPFALLPWGALELELRRRPAPLSASR